MKMFLINYGSILEQGTLYSTEVDLLAGMSGMVEVENNSLILIDELIDEEVENYIIPGKSIKGCIFFISCVYYRSSWKYQDRSLRYCFLDSDHHLGAIAR